jgi:nucleotide-binding universal stress UspA family protein
MRSYLVVGNQTLVGPALSAAIAERIAADDQAQFYIVVPATPIQDGFTWDEHKAQAAAQERLEAMIANLLTRGVEATGEVGHKDPVEAARDAMRRHPVDEVILSTLPSGISRWLGQDAPSRLKAAVSVPVVVVTAEAVESKAAAG